MSDEPLPSLDARVRRQVEKARQALAVGEPGVAAAILAPVLRDHPGCVEARRLHLRALGGGRASGRKSLLSGLPRRPWQALTPSALRRDPQKLLRQAEDCIAAQPRAPQGFRLLAAAAEALALPHTALFALETLCNLRPTDREALHQRASLHLSLGQNDEAIAVAEAALRSFPAAREFRDLLHAASVAASLEQGTWSEGHPSGSHPPEPAPAGGVGEDPPSPAAGAHPEETNQVDTPHPSLAGDADHPELAPQRAEALAARGQYAEARETLALVRESPEGAADPSLRSLELTYLRRHLDQQVADRRAEMEAHPGDRARREAWEEAERERRDILLEETGQQVTSHPRDPVARAAFGDLLLEAGRYDEAIPHYQRALPHPQARVRSRHGLGRAYAAKGFHDLAAGQLRAAAAELPDPTEERKAILYDLADVLEAMGRPEEAIGLLKEIYTVDIGFREVARRVEAYYGSAPGS